MDMKLNIQNSYSTQPDKEQIEILRPGIKKINQIQHGQDDEYYREIKFDLNILDLKLVKTVAQLRYFGATQATKMFHDKSKNEFSLEEKMLFCQQLSQIMAWDTLSNNTEIILELCLAMAEFAKRGIAWNNLTVEAIGLYEGHVMIDKLEFDFQSIPDEQLSLRNFKKFMFYFPDFSKKIQNLNSYEAIVNEALNLFPALTQSDFRYPQYYGILEKIFQIKLENPISEQGSNSHVYKMSIPSMIKNKFMNILWEETHIVIKSTIIQQNQEEVIIKQTLNNIDREIDLNEQLPLDLCFATAFCYIRIGQQSFLFMRHYPQTLNDCLQNIKKKKISPLRPVEVYKIAKSIAEAIYYIHEFGIMHRDLKPGNIFLTTNSIGNSALHIADFDRSKLQNQQSLLMQTSQCNTAQYDPPEAALEKKFQTSKVDIWQFGLIMVEVANQGEYYGNRAGSYYVPQYEEKYGPEAIYKLLAPYQYKQDFLNLINECLKKNPQERPSGLQIYQKAKQLINSSINMLSSTHSSNSQSPIHPQSRNSVNSLNESQSSLKRITLISVKQLNSNDNTIQRQQTQ